MASFTGCRLCRRPLRLDDSRHRDIRGGWEGPLSQKARKPQESMPGGLEACLAWHWLGGTPGRLAGWLEGYPACGEPKVIPPVGNMKVIPPVGNHKRRAGIPIERRIAHIDARSPEASMPGCNMGRRDGGMACCRGWLLYARLCPEAGAGRLTRSTLGEDGGLVSYSPSRDKSGILIEV